MVVVGINTAEESSPWQNARKFQQKHGLTYPILLDQDGKVRKAYRVENFPTNVVIDRTGKVQSIEVGFNPDALTKTLNELLGP